MLIVIEYKELCCLISSSRVTFSRDLIKGILVLSRVAGWAVGLFNIFLVVRGKGHFFRSLSITCSIPNFRFFFSQQLAVAETRFRFLFFPIFSARWQLLNPTPFSFSEQQGGSC
jgi:hypothetical protein